MCVNPTNIEDKNRANVSLKILAICFTLLSQSLVANAILANNERESNSALNLSSFQLSLRALHFYAMRGNLYLQSEKYSFNKLNQIDCHEFASANSRNDGNVNSHNDEIFCRTKRKRSVSKRSFFRKSKNANIDISRLRAQYDNVVISPSLVNNNSTLSPSLAELQASCPPSIAEGVRGRVFLDSTAVIASGLDFLESKTRGTSPQLQSSNLARKREWAQLRKQNLYSNANKADCHEFASANSRNDESKINQQKYIKLAKIDSIRTDFVQAYLPQEATTSKIDSTQKHLPQTTMDSMQVANNTANAQNNAFINNHRDISRYALNMTNDIDSMKSTESMQTDSTPQAFDKSHQYNKLKKSNDLESTNLQAKDLGKVSVSATTGFDLPLKEEVKNVIIIDKEDLQNKGYTNLEDALAKQPFISFIAGPQGTKNIDIRGQGYDAPRAVKILINRVPINLNDNGNPNSGHGGTSTTPFNHISIDEIQSIEIIPGGGSVIYGGGTRGGVVNIVTKKPSKDYARFSLRGLGYEAKGSFGGGVGISAGKAIGNKLFVSASADYSHQDGLRQGEYDNTIYTAFQTIYQIAPNHKLDFNISYSKMWRYFAGYHQRANCDTPNATGTSCETWGYFKTIDELKKERYTSPSGIGSSQNSNGEVGQDFIQTSLNYNANFSENLAFDALTFYQFSNFLFPSQELGGNTRNTFSNQGAGLNLKLKHKIPKNTLIVGLDNQIELSDNNSQSSFTQTQNKGQKYSVSLYAFDSIKFVDWFSLGVGARGDFSYFMIQGHTGMNFMNMNGYFETNAQKPQWGYAAEITPAFHYGDSGIVYIKGEIGYTSPSVREVVSSDLNYNATSTGLAPKIPSNIEPEQYFTGEIGWREYFKNSSLSASVFYTHTLNEIRHRLDGFRVTYFNIGQTQRLVAEIMGRQTIASVLELVESVSYLYTNVLKGKSSIAGGTSNGGFIEGKPIPYAPLFKLTIGANYEILHKGENKLSLWINNSWNGNQVDYNQVDMNANGYFLSDIGLNYKYRHFNLSAGVRNVFDTFYIAYQSSNISSTAGISATYLAGASRSYFVDMRLNF
ncbi:TonB-dependent receptor [Helicobacter sp. T3_23-1059]